MFFFPVSFNEKKIKQIKSKKSQTRHFVTSVQVFSVPSLDAVWEGFFSQLALSIADANFSAALLGPCSVRPDVAGYDAFDVAAAKNKAK